MNLETVQKVNTYVKNICKDINILTLDENHIVEIGALLDAIRKNTEDTVKTIKKYLLDENILNGEHIEIDGILFRARYGERKQFEINPIELKRELSENDFMKCISVNLTKTGEILPEKIFNKLKIEKGITKQVTFQKKG